MKSILERSRYLALIGIISLLVASFAAFIWGTIKTVFTTLLVIQTLGKDSTITIELIELIDIFLIATTILIFAASLYELFIGKLDMPEWMLAHDLYELKAKLSSMI
ncbi:MAG TPA: YqhA family protein, partial [Anaerolineales bacterium]|nr:YqhA family protein [Anaerolineales bacterium]